MKPLDGYRRLACAVLVRAWKDAENGNGRSSEAWAWLHSDGARWLVAALDLDPARLDVALARLPAPAYPIAEQLALPFDVAYQRPKRLLTGVVRGGEPDLQAQRRRLAEFHAAGVVRQDIFELIDAELTAMQVGGALAERVKSASSG